jgi:DNA polymerase III alpha subunit
MHYNVLPLFKSHYSRGKSIFNLEEAKDKKGKPVENSLFHVCQSNDLDTLVLVEDDISGLLQASENAKKGGVKLVFGLRLWITDDATEKHDGVFTKQTKYIIIAKKKSDYPNLIKIWNYAAKDGFYYEPRLDFKTLRKNWSDTLSLFVPFYDSFLHLNSFNSHTHVPQYDFTKPTFLVESNNLPFDDYLASKVEKYAKQNNHPTLPAQSIFYKTSDDFIAYLANRCLHNRTTIEKPELDHMGSDEFNFEKWRQLNGR